MKIIAGNSNKILAEAICSYIGVSLANTSLRRFADREIFVEINENIRGEDVFIIQSTSHPANDHLMELLITIDAAKTYALLKIQTSAAAWVTLYTDSTSRSNDSSRNETTDPTPGSGVIAEVITTGSATQIMTPGLIGWNNDGTPAAQIYARVYNKRATSGSNAITVTLTSIKLES